MEIKSKVYYEITTGNVIHITPEFIGFVERTKDQDMSTYVALKDKNINDVDFIELEYGTLLSIFNNLKSFHINLELKSLEYEYYTAEELQAMQSQDQESQILNNRISDISDYLQQQSDNVITDFEDYILQKELNKTLEGMI